MAYLYGEVGEYIRSELPSELGVRAENEITDHLEFTVGCPGWNRGHLSPTRAQAPHEPRVKYNHDINFHTRDHYLNSGIDHVNSAHHDLSDVSHDHCSYHLPANC